MLPAYAPSADPPRAGGYALAKPTGELLAVDDGFARLLQRTAQALRATSLVEATFAADREAVLQALERLLARDAPVEVRKRYVRADGGAVWVAERLTRLHADGETLLLADATPLPSPRDAGRVTYV